MIEFALVLILLVMLLVGTVSAAVAYGRSNSIQNAAREASRFGATLPEVSNNLDQVVDVARSAATGDLDPSVPGQTICVAFVAEDDSATSLIDVGGVGSSGSAPCFSDGRDEEARVQVAVQRESRFQVIVFSTDVTLSADAAARYER